MEKQTEAPRHRSVNNPWPKQQIETARGGFRNLLHEGCVQRQHARLAIVDPGPQFFEHALHPPLLSGIGENSGEQAEYAGNRDRGSKQDS
jgi:hypothetical protein